MGIIAQGITTVKKSLRLEAGEPENNNFTTPYAPGNQEYDRDAKDQRVGLPKLAMVKLVASTIILLGLAFSMAGVMHEMERPTEMLAQEIDAWQRDTISRQYITRLFRFYDIPIRRGLGSCTNCHDCYDGYEIPGATFEGVYYPPQKGIYPEPNGERWYKTAEEMCSGPEEPGCFLICALRQPTVKQVEACRSEDTLFQVYKEDKVVINPAYFNTTCLSSSPECPNCNVLNKRIEDLQFEIVNYTDTEGRRFLQLAEIYTVYKQRIESNIPETNWDFRGSLFFAFTVLSTVGYGNYAPAANESKLILIFLTVPGVAVFGYALSQFADIFMGVILYLKSKTGLFRDRTRPISSRARRWADVLRTCDKDGDGELTRDEVEGGALEICRIIGMSLDDDDDDALGGYLDDPNRVIQVAPGRGGGGGGADAGGSKKKAKLDEVVTFLREAFDEADEDCSGTLDMLEAMAMISELVHIRQLKYREAVAKENAATSILLLIPIIIAGTFIFQALEPEGKLNTLDAFYFSVISVSTVGLGDIAPTKGASRYFWYTYMTLALGLVASCIQSVGNVISAAGVRMEMMAVKRTRREGHEAKKKSLAAAEAAEGGKNFSAD